MSHKLPDLPYDFNALAPHIDARTMTIHHDKHHQAYVTNLNKALEGHPSLQEKSALELLLDLDNIPESIRGAVRNHGGGHVNHTMFWTVMSANGGGAPSGSLAKEIDESFGSFEDFKAAFAKAAGGVFGSGWAWLCVGAEGKLVIHTTPNQDNPISTVGHIPILGLDVWEHAYYLEYQNRRPDYISAFWNVVNWDQVSDYRNLVKIEEGVTQVTSWIEAKWNRLEEILDSLKD